LPRSCSPIAATKTITCVETEMTDSDIDKKHLCIIPRCS
jgi:hypothetical protein